MKQQIKEAIQSIIREKLNNNEAFPCAHSVEVAHRLKMNAREIEIICKGIDDIKTHLTVNGEYYEAKVN